MKYIFKSILLMAVMVFTATCNVLADDEAVLALEDFTGVQGGHGTLSVLMNNTKDITAYQFDIVLPEGVSAVSIANADRAAENHAPTLKLIDKSTNTYRAAAFSTTNTPFTGTEGAICDITLDIDESVELGSKTIQITGIELVAPDNTIFHPDEVNCQMTVKSYDKGYYVEILPFKITTTDESTNANVFINTATACTSVSFDVAFSNSDFKTQDLIETASLVSGRGTSCTITPNDDGTYSITATKTSGFTANSNIDIAKFTIYSQDEAGIYTIPEGVYNASISNIALADASKSYDVKPYSANIYVGSPKASVTGEGKVTFAGDYSDEDVAKLLTDAMPTTDASITEVDLKGVTALPEGTTIAVANPNALIEISVDLGLSNDKNVVIGNTCSNLVLKDDGSAFSTSKAFTATSATYSRSMSNEWGTICLPYAVKSNETTSYYNIDRIDGSVLYLTKATELEAGTPALVYTSNGGITPESTSVTITGSMSNPTDISGKVIMCGCYTATTVTDENAYYIKNNKFWQRKEGDDGKFYINPFRAYFTIDSSVSAARQYTICTEDTPTVIEVLTGNTSDEIDGIYSMNGNCQSKMQNGVNVIRTKGGKSYKVVIK